MLSIIGVLAAMLSPVSGDAPAVADNAPIFLVAESAGEGIKLLVKGSAAEEFQASFTLEVNSNTRGGGNKTTHRGGVRLAPGETVILSTVNLGAITPGHWEARLTVKPSHGESYEMIKTTL